MSKLTDKQIARKLERAHRLLSEAVGVLDETADISNYFAELAFDLHCKTVDVETQAHWFRHNTDPVR